MSIKDILGQITGKSDVGADVIDGFFTNILGERSGGLQALLEKFHASGLGHVASSWVSKGENLPISADEIKNVLGSDEVQALANRFNLPVETVTQMLADHLPHLVHKMTPEGKMPADK